MRILSTLDHEDTQFKESKTQPGSGRTTPSPSSQAQYRTPVDSVHNLPTTGSVTLSVRVEVSFTITVLAQGGALIVLGWPPLGLLPP